MTSIDLETGSQTTIAQNERADFSGALIHPTEKNVQAAAFTYERKQWQVLDDRRWIVAYTIDSAAVRYYRYDREEKRLLTKTASQSWAVATEATLRLLA